MTKNYVKFGPISLTAWQYEIFGCIIFYFCAATGYGIYLFDCSDKPYAWIILIPSTLLLIIGIYSPINVYYKEKAGYYDNPYND